MNQPRENYHIHLLIAIGMLLSLQQLPAKSRERFVFFLNKTQTATAHIHFDIGSVPKRKLDFVCSQKFVCSSLNRSFISRYHVGRIAMHTFDRLQSPIVSSVRRGESNKSINDTRVLLDKNMKTLIGCCSSSLKMTQQKRNDIKANCDRKHFLQAKHALQLICY